MEPAAPAGALSRDGFAETMSELSDLNKAQVQRYISYFKAKRERLLAERESEKTEFISDRLADDQAIFSRADVEEMLETFHSQTAGSVREALEGFVNLSAVYVSQVLHRAESFGVPIDIDMAAIEDQNSIDQIASLALQGFVPAAMGKRNANLPSLGGVPPPPSPLGPAGDLNTMAKMQELEQDNAQLRERYSQMQQQVSELTHERSQLSEQLDQAGAQVALSQSQLSEHVGSSSQFRDLKDILRKRTEEVKLLREYIASAGLDVPGTEGGVELLADDD